MTTLPAVAARPSTLGPSTPPGTPTLPGSLAVASVAAAVVGGVAAYLTDGSMGAAVASALAAFSLVMVGSLVLLGVQIARTARRDGGIA